MPAVVPPFRPPADHKVIAINASSLVECKKDNKWRYILRLQIGEQTFVMHTEAKGPLRIYRDEQNEIVYCRTGGTPVLLRTVSDVVI